MKKTHYITNLHITFFVIFLFIVSSCQNQTNSNKQGSLEVNDSISEFTFAFITDIHLQPELNAVDGFKKAIDTINQLNPDFVITGGDLIMDALAQTYEHADSLYNLYIETANGFTMPVYNGIGNHELFGLYEKSGIDPGHEEFSKKMFEKRIGKSYYSFNHKGWHFMVLDAIGESPERKYFGNIDSMQMKWIKKDLEQVKSDIPIVISAHIPFITSMIQIQQGALEPNPKGLVINNSKEVLRLFDNHNLKLVLQGHLHYLEEITVNQKTHFITAGAISSGWWEGAYNDTEEGFVMVHVKNNKFDWEYIDYQWEVDTTLIID